jgi:hypothetical protein
MRTNQLKSIVNALPDALRHDAATLAERPEKSDDIPPKNTNPFTGRQVSGKSHRQNKKPLRLTSERFISACKTTPTITDAESLT